MSNLTNKFKYRCWDDCVQSGCPSHIARLSVQTTSDAYHFEDGKGREWYFQPPEFIALVKMLSELAPGSVYVESMLKEAFEPSPELGENKDNP